MDLTKITMPYGLLDEETQRLLRAARTSGETIQSYEGVHGWQDVWPNWNYAAVYRVRPSPKPPAIELPWEVIDPRWKWVARNENGAVYLHQDTPFVQRDNWTSDSRARWITHVFDGIRINVTDWKQSLTKRPE